MERLIDGLLVQCIRGDITKQPDVDAIVNAANAELRRGAALSGAIHDAAGPDLEREAVSLGPIEPGEAVITGAHRLPNRFVIHCLGPRYGLDHPAPTLLADCYRNALKLAETRAVSSVAFPAISIGVFGYPAEKAAPVSLGAVAETAPTLKTVRLVRFVLFEDWILEWYDAALRALEG
jgi:O-acetyl-ADP-ribose deacetylase (regulator of RNase III)